MQKYTKAPETRGDRCLGILLLIAGSVLAIDLLTGNRYGFHRDELATLDDAHHLAWGYVAYPPVTPFFGWLSLHLFGGSLAGFRFFAALADASGVFLTGLIARELGGRRWAQILAAAAAIPFSMAAGTLIQYVSFDYLAWVACSYFFVRLRGSNDPRWWLAIGASIGVGMLTKYSMLICATAIGIAVLFSDLRSHLRSRWIWFGVALSLLIFLPNFLWQLNHHFVSLDFLRHIHERDVRIGRTKDFLPDQLRLTFLMAPLALLGLCFYLFGKNGARFRPTVWIYVFPLFAFLMAKGRGYYLAPAYPILYAGGSVLLEHRMANWRTVFAMITRAIVSVATIANILIAAAFLVPVAPIDSAWAQYILKSNDDFREEVGWEELVQTVAHIRDSLPETDRTRLKILAGNYGEAGAVSFYGPRYGLPPVICGTNSFWARGYGDPPPDTVIALGLSREFLEEHFESCELAGEVTNRLNVVNEEVKSHREVFVCRKLRGDWPDFWKTFRRYG